MELSAILTPAPEGGYVADLAPSPQRGEGWGEGLSPDSLKFHIARDITSAKTAMQSSLKALLRAFVAFFGHKSGIK